MAKIIIIGGIESTFTYAQTLYELGEEILMLYTRGINSPGWENIDLVDQRKYEFLNHIPTTIVNSNINDYASEIASLAPDFIYSLGWQQVFKEPLLGICKILGLHESLLPRGAGPAPIANAILHGEIETGCTLFWLDSGVDTGPIIGQLKCINSPLTSNSTHLYSEIVNLGAQLLKMYLPYINNCTAPSLPQDFSKRICYGKINWDQWPREIVMRARTYPYA